MDISFDFKKSCFLHVDANVLLNIQATEIKSKVYHAEQQIEERENRYSFQVILFLFNTDMANISNIWIGVLLANFGYLNK